jgi:hypothetical protein
MPRLIVCLFFFTACLAGCSFKAEADKKFGDQNFKTAISLIELYKVRTGTYPESLRDLTFTGDWDQLAIHSVQYERVGSGYALNIVHGWVGVPQLSYPAEFWHGLGIVSTNAAGLTPHSSGP